MASVLAVRTVLGHSDQRRIQFGWGACVAAEGAQMVALGVYAFATGGVVAVGLVGVVRTVPAALVGPFAVAFADRWPRSRVLTGVLWARCGALASIAILVATDAPAVTVYVLAAADALAFSLYWPFHSALQPELASTPDELTAANAATTMNENLGMLFGPAAAGTLLAFHSATAAFAAAGALLVPAAVTVNRVRSRRPGGRPPATPARELLAGFVALGRQPAPRLVAGIYLAQSLCLGAVPVFVVVTALELLAIGESGVGSLQAAVGAGGLVGALGALALVGSGRLAAVLGAAVTAWGVCLALIGVLPVPVAAMVLLAGVGVGNALVDVSALTLLQRLVPQEVLGRALGAFEGIWWAMVGAGALAASLLVESVGVRGALLAFGAVLPALTLMSARSLARIDASQALPARELDLLRRVPLLTPLTTPALERLARACVPVTAAAGTVVIKAGAVGDRFYVIEEGDVEIVGPGWSRRLGPGEGFGEIALLHDVLRTATVTAVDACRLLAVEREDFIAAVTDHPVGVRTLPAPVDRRPAGGAG